MGFRHRSPREILCVPWGFSNRGPSKYAETAELHVDAVINKIFLIMLLRSGQAQDMVFPSTVDVQPITLPLLACEAESSLKAAA